MAKEPFNEYDIKWKYEEIRPDEIKSNWTVQRS